MDAVVQLAIEGSVAPCLRAEADKLIEAIEKAKHEKQVLRMKFEQIQDFKTIVVMGLLVVLFCCFFKLCFTFFFKLSST